MEILRLWQQDARRILQIASAALLVAVAWALSRLPLEIAALFVALPAAGLLILRWPWLIWASIALVLPMTSGIKFGMVSATDLLLVVAVGLWLADGARRGTLKLTWSPLLWPLLLYTGVLYLSLFFAQILGEAAAEVVKWVEFAAILLLVRAMCSLKQARWLVAAMVVGAMLQATLGLYQFVNRIGPEWFVILDRFMRASGSFRQPNPYAGYLGMTLPVAVSMAIWAWTRMMRSDSERRTYLLWGIFYGAASGLIAAGLLASWSRGGWLGAFVGVGIVIVLRSRKAAVVSVMLGLALLVALLIGSIQPEIVPAPVAARLQDIPAYLGLTDVLNQPLTDENFAVQERVAHWAAALRMWERAPWFGVGAGNYEAVYPEVRLAFWEEPLGHAHNIYLNHLGETGLIGLLAFLTLWGTLAIWVWRRFRVVGRNVPHSAFAGWRAALALGVLGVMAHVTLHNVFDNLFVQGMYVQLALWVAILTIDGPAEDLE